MKLTLARARILRAFLDDPAVPRYGSDLSADLDIAHGGVFQALRRVEAEGLLVSEPEQPVPQDRPARRYYRLTPAGERYARLELAALADQLRPPHEDTVTGIGEIQVVWLPALQQQLREWLDSRGLYLFRIPLDDDALPTYGISWE